MSFYIEDTETWDTGGNIQVDIVRLKNGKIIGISDDCVCLYDNEDQFWEDDPNVKCISYED